MQRYELIWGKINAKADGNIVLHREAMQEIAKLKEAIAALTDKLGEQIAALRADLALNAKMLAHQCDLARQAETERDVLKSELAAYKENNYDPSEAARLNSEIMVLKAEVEKYRKKLLPQYSVGFAPFLGAFGE